MCTMDHDCDVDLICDKGRCGTTKRVSPGAGCANVGEICPRGEYCTSAKGVPACGKRQGKGQPCASNDICLESLRCGASALCEDRLAIGSGCTVNDDCATHYCSPYSAVCEMELNFARNSDSCRGFLATPKDGGSDGP